MRSIDNRRLAGVWFLLTALLLVGSGCGPQEEAGTADEPSRGEVVMPDEGEAAMPEGGEAEVADEGEAVMPDEAPRRRQAVAGQEEPRAIPMRANDETRPSPNASVTQNLGTTVVTITYGRPGVKGRDIFGALVPYGSVWRTGANEATVFSVTDAVTINGRELPAGVYGLFTIPGETEWTVIFNRQPAQWGASDYDQSQDALRVTATPEEAAAVEWFGIYFGELTDTSAKAYLHWDTVRVPFTIATQ